MDVFHNSLLLERKLIRLKRKESKWKRRGRRKRKRKYIKSLQKDHSN